MLDTALSRRSVEYNTLSGTEKICHSDGTPLGFIVGFFAVFFSHSPYMTSTVLSVCDPALLKFIFSKIKLYYTYGTLPLSATRPLVAANFRGLHSP